MSVEKWSTVATVWAAVEPLRGREYFEAAAVQAETTTRIRVRHRNDITPGNRIQHGLVVYDVQAAIDKGGRQRELELMCREVAAGD